MLLNVNSACLNPQFIKSSFSHGKGMKSPKLDVLKCSMWQRLRSLNSLKSSCSGVSVQPNISGKSTAVQAREVNSDHDYDGYVFEMFSDNDEIDESELPTARESPKPEIPIERPSFKIDGSDPDIEYLVIDTDPSPESPKPDEDESGEGRWLL